MRQIHVTVGRPSAETSNGVLQTVYSISKAKNDFPKSAFYYMSTSNNDGPINSRSFRPGLIGVIKVAIAISKNSDLQRVYYYGGCQWRFWVLVVIAKLILKNRILHILVPSGSYSCESFSRRNLFKRAFTLHVETLFNLNFDYIQALNLAEKTYVQKINKRFPNYRLSVIPNFVDSRVSRLPNAAAGSSLRILFLGRKDFFYKGLKETCDAVEGLLRIGTPVTFSAYGPYPSRADEALFQKVVLKNRDAVFDFKPVYGADKASVFSGYDVFILASRSEGLPTALLEAAQSGLVCLATRETNLDAEDFAAGVIEIGRDADDIAEKILLCWELTGDKSFLRNQMMHFRKKYSPSGVSALHHDYYGAL